MLKKRGSACHLSVLGTDGSILEPAVSRSELDPLGRGVPEGAFAVGQDFFCSLSKINLVNKTREAKRINVRLGKYGVHCTLRDTFDIRMVFSSPFQREEATAA